MLSSIYKGELFKVFLKCIGESEGEVPETVRSTSDSIYAILYEASLPFFAAQVCIPSEDLFSYIWL